MKKPEPIVLEDAESDLFSDLLVVAQAAETKPEKAPALTMQQALAIVDPAALEEAATSNVFLTVWFSRFEFEGNDDASVRKDAAIQLKSKKQELCAEGSTNMSPFDGKALNVETMIVNEVGFTVGRSIGTNEKREYSAVGQWLPKFTVSA